MRPIPLAFFLIGPFVAYFAIHAATGLGDVSLTPGFAVPSALAAVCLLFAHLFAHIDGPKNQPPKPTYFVIDKVNGPVLELETNGSYERCELFLTTLAAEFSAEYSGHFDGGRARVWTKTRVFGTADNTRAVGQFRTKIDFTAGACIPMSSNVATS